MMFIKLMTSSVVDISQIGELSDDINTRYYDIELPSELQQSIMDTLPGWILGTNYSSECIVSSRNGFSWMVRHNSKLVSMHVEINIECGHINFTSHTEKSKDCPFCKLSCDRYGNAQFKYKSVIFEYLRNKKYTNYIKNIKIQIFTNIDDTDYLQNIRMVAEKKLLKYTKKHEIYERAFSRYTSDCI